MIAKDSLQSEWIHQDAGAGIEVVPVRLMFDLDADAAMILSGAHSFFVFVFPALRL